MITTLLHDVPKRVDVVVIGSGAAGLTAAVRAADGGAEVVVLEKASQLGGTTAIGGGVIWAPANNVAHTDGFVDSREEALNYVLAAGAGRLSEDEAQWYVDSVVRAVDYLSEHTHVALRPLARPDYRMDLPGAKAGGRSLDNDPFHVGRALGAGGVLRTSSYFPLLTMAERDGLNGAAPDPAVLAERASAGVRTMGGALVASLLVSVLERGVKIVTDARVTSLRPDDDVATSTLAGPLWHVSVGEQEQSVDLVADAVIIASGGFEWNTELQRAFLAHPITPISAPSNEGDGLKLGMELGAALAEMTAFWGVPVITPPGKFYDGSPLGRMANVEMSLPGSLTVGADGRRFVNEALNYNDVSRVMGAIDEHQLVAKGMPAWLIFDQRFLDSYPVAGSTPGTPEKWMSAGASVQELAQRIGIDPALLSAQVENFNRTAELGEDPEFGRGNSVEDRFLGDASVTPNPCLRPLTGAPFYAVPIHCGALGTAGGLATDCHAQVLRFDGSVIPGLYAAGNVSATAFRGAYPAGGATLGSAVTRGFVAGEHVAAAIASKLIAPVSSPAHSTYALETEGPSHDESIHPRAGL